MDDELADLLRAADPARTPRDAKPHPTALAMRDAIVEGRGARSPGRHRTLVWSVATAAVAVIVAAVMVLVPHAPVVAATPTPLSFTPGLTLKEIEDRATAAQTGTGGPSEPARRSTSTGWYLAAGDGRVRTKIQPQISTLTWKEDGSGVATIVAGVPYSPVGAANRGEDDAPAPGTVISELEYGPGEFAPPVVAAPGSSPEAVAELLGAFGMPLVDATAGAVVDSTVSVFGMWTLTDEQHARLISLVVSAPGATALGETTDRAGRPVFGVQADSIWPGVRDIVLISAETGRIVGVESTRLTDGDPLIPAGAVFSYTLWDVPESAP